MTYPPPPGTPGGPPKAAGLGRTAKLLIVVAALATLLCCCGGLAGGGFWLYRTVQDATAGPRDALTGYLADVRAGNYPAAYDRLCELLRNRTTEEEFTRERAAEPPRGADRITNTTVRTSNGRSRAEVHVVSDNGPAEVFQLVHEGDQWRVCS
ncbi:MULTISPECIES: Rv0361 family membrane protein [Micromonospora]|uniref:DUF4878 domain-containing protein n=1 Tax=Micromonospora yangpuensis TaxID=683228 RepID=A0A1C6VDP6_9ACTN|nr:hypothetical protein [Micromonospora yangpuensis]GGM13625.1 hypothetical protein GCM10012279_34760 [Micromonospora yangpuensis]SCL64277.1 protein of unknown function [Micromonospora yangpuensis]